MSAQRAGPLPYRTPFLEGDNKIISKPWFLALQAALVATNAALTISTDDALLFYVPGTLQKDTHPVRTALLSAARTVSFQAQVGTAPLGQSIIVLITVAPLTAPDTPTTIATLTILAGQLISNVSASAAIAAGSIVNLVISEVGVNPNEGAYLMAGPVTT